MIFVSTFATSGLAILVLIILKKLEERRRKPLFISNAISKSEIYVKRLHHLVVYLYSEGKEKIHFILSRSIPLHSKNSSNKLLTTLREKKEFYVNQLRDSRLLKRSDGISEFFQSMSSVEKGNGEINDFYEDDFQDGEKRVD